MSFIIYKINKVNSSRNKSIINKSMDKIKTDINKYLRKEKKNDKNSHQDKSMKKS